MTEYTMALRSLCHLYGHTAAANFGPLALKAVRGLMTNGYVHPRHGPQGKLCRGVINQRTGRLKRVWKWAVAEELIPVSAYQALTTVKGLQRGRSDARETERVRPVAWEHVEATLPQLLPSVRAMVLLQWHTGMRPGEVCVMRTGDLDTWGAVWQYRPHTHKLSYRGTERVIAIGPKAQAVLKPWLRADLTAYLFSPREAMEEVRRERHTRRRTPLSCGNKPGSNRLASPAKKYSGRWHPSAYHKSVRLGCRKADEAARVEAVKAGMSEEDAAVRVFVPVRAVNQLRHSAATEIRKWYGLEAAQAALGHQRADVTQLYAEKNLGLAVEVAAKIG